jgi:endonuclease III
MSHETETDSAERIDKLLRNYGQTYAQQAGIRLADKPSPLYQLLVLATLLSTRISAGVAVSAARELFTAGYRTPARMSEASWQDRVDALGRGHYKRYDESTARTLGDSADMVSKRYRGDLRRLRDEANGDAKEIAELLKEFRGIGPAGASIFLREVQETWPSVAPYVDDRMAEGARRADLASGRDDLTALLTGSDHPARLAAGLVRLSLTRGASLDSTPLRRRPVATGPGGLPAGPLLPQRLDERDHVPPVLGR